MTTELFIACFALGLAILFRWSFKHLPGESWQVIGAMPCSKTQDGRWNGINLTYYGFFVANAYVLGTAVCFILLGAAGVPPTGSIILAGSLLLPCIAASKLVARVVEKKKYTFSVAGAVFVAIIITPPIIIGVDATAGRWMGFELHVMTAAAAMSIAYAFGEGAGRLACISYGCCYGKPIGDLPPTIQRCFRNHYFVFSGKTKKIAYADGFDGQKVVPVQAITAILYCLSGLIGAYLFLKGYVIIAFFVTLIVTQGWRFLSEFLRADYRGQGKITAYQIMGMVGLAYASVLAVVLSHNAPAFIDLATGLGYLWSPAVILFLQALWLLTFIFKGRSQVTGATLSFHVHEHRI